MHHNDPSKYTQFIPRQSWGADPLTPEGIPPLKTPVSNVVAAWTDTEPCKTMEECSAAVRKIQQKHIEAGFPDITHNFLVGGDGALYEGRGWRFQGPTYPSTVEDYEILNDNSIEIAFIDHTCDKPSDRQFETLSSVITDGQELNTLAGIFTFYIQKGKKITLFRTYDPVKDYKDIVPEELWEQWSRKQLAPGTYEQVKQR